MSQTAKKLGAVIVGLALVIPLVLVMFISPASRATPHAVPIGVVGPKAAVGQVAQTVIATGAAPMVATMLTEIGKAMPTAGRPTAPR